MVASIRFTWAR